MRESGRDAPGYYGVIKSEVLFDKGLCASAKILYAHITALCNKEGYCWATNSCI